VHVELSFRAEVREEFFAHDPELRRVPLIPTWGTKILTNQKFPDSLSFTRRIVVDEDSVRSALLNFSEDLKVNHSALTSPASLSCNEIKSLKTKEKRESVARALFDGLSSSGVFKGPIEETYELEWNQPSLICFACGKTNWEFTFRRMREFRWTPRDGAIYLELLGMVNPQKSDGPGYSKEPHWRWECKECNKTASGDFHPEEPLSVPSRIFRWKDMAPTYLPWNIRINKGTLPKPKLY
jgi:hypothetical protein